MIIKIKRKLRKNVSYMGRKFSVPIEHKFMAIDCDGWLYSYGVRPFLTSNAECPEWFCHSSNYEKIAEIDLYPIDYKKTLKEIN